MKRDHRTEDALGCLAAAILGASVLTTAVLLIGLATTWITYRPWMLLPFVGASFAGWLAWEFGRQLRRG